MRKVLWIVDGDKNGLLAKADYVRAQSVCIRTTNVWLQTSVKEIKDKGFDVYAWRWPAVIDPGPGHDAHHHYVDNEARYVQQLIDDGLDGYIVDPEADREKGPDGKQHPRLSDWWADAKYGPLANSFSDAIKLPGRKKNPHFLFGTTSGCTYPTVFKAIPWPEFVSHSDALFPQCYWQGNSGPEHGGTPQSSYNQGMKSWKTIAPSGLKIIPIIGQIAKVSDSQINDYNAIIKAHAITEIHFYSYTSKVPPENWDAMRALGTNVA
jgi:hypothetical protein